MSTKNSTAVGVIVALLIVGAVGTLGYYQLEVAAKQTSTTTTSATTSGVNCSATPSQCKNITITSGAASPYNGYTSGSKTLYGYSPLTVTVVIGKNNTVVWTNMDTAFHTATSVSAPSGSSGFDTGCLDGVGAPCPSSSGTSSYQFTFTVAGTYTYHCNYHPWMRGTVVVKSG